MAKKKAPSLIIEYLKLIGSKGGSANTPAQNAARAENGKLGGRPRTVSAKK